MRLLGILLAIISFILLVIGHEFGHFSIGKLLGFKINEFSVGMGPKLWSQDKGETTYSLRAVPIGGFCAFEGEDGEEDDEDGKPKDPDPRSFNLQPAWKKILVLVAGSFNNIVIGIIIFTIIFAISGSYSNKLAEVVEGKPAAEAGILAGDRVVSVNGAEMSDWLDITDAISKSEGDTILIGVQRDEDGKTVYHEYSVKTYLNEEGRRVVGIVTSLDHSFGTAVKSAFSECSAMIRALRDFFGRLFRGQAKSDEVGSIVQIVDAAGDYAVNYGLRTVIYLIALVSVNLGFMNLLPIPGLDGGRILFVVIRWITRGKLSDRVENVINNVFMIALIALMIFLIFKDVVTLVR